MGSAKGVKFLTLEDETGSVNAVVWPTLFERRCRIVRSASMMAINGMIQQKRNVVHLVVSLLFGRSDDLGGCENGTGDFPCPMVGVTNLPTRTSRSGRKRRRVLSLRPDLLINRMKVKAGILIGRCSF